MKRKYFAFALIIAAFCAAVLQGCYVGYGYHHPHYYHYYRY